MKCPMCSNPCFMDCPKSSVETREEYIKSCNTEELAELLYEYRYDNANPKDRLWLEANKRFCKHTIVEWLKQPHHNEVEK